MVGMAEGGNDGGGGGREGKRERESDGRRVEMMIWKYSV